MQRHLLVLMALSLAIALLPFSAIAEDKQVRVKFSQVPLLRCTDIDSDPVRWALEGECFAAVTDVDGFYLVKDEATESFLYLHFTDAEVLIDELPDNIKISGRMPMPDQIDLSYWQVAPSEKNMDRTFMRSKSRDEMLTAHNGKKYPASYDPNMDYRPVVDGRELASEARRYLGAQYTLGGTTKEGGIDCSSLTKVCLAQQGIDVVHRASLQALEGR